MQICLYNLILKISNLLENEASLDLSAAKMTEFSDRVVSEGNDKILPMAAIYGANASGKSNIYNAFEYMADYVIESFKYGDEEEKFEEYRPTPFLFDSVSMMRSPVLKYILPFQEIRRKKHIIMDFV